jgi:hypothetical protein
MSDQPPPTDPAPLSAGQLPSSFETEFFEENRFQKVWRKLRQEPLIPIGCAATCYALYLATKSIREGDHHQTNRMFRARIYAQGFTLLALVAGSIFYKDERLKRKAFEAKFEEKKAAEKREKWLAELEARDKEDREWREKIEKASMVAQDGVEEAKRKVGRVADGGKEVAQQFADAVPEPGDVQQAEKKKGGSWFSSKSVLEEVREDGWGPGTWTSRTRSPWTRF